MVSRKKTILLWLKLVWIMKSIRNLCPFRRMALLCDAFGKVLEWLKRHAWKACIRQKRIRGSNPLLSAADRCKEFIVNILNNSIN